MTTPTLGPLVERGTDNTLVVSSETIAAGSDVQHKNVLGLIEVHSDSLREFGEVAFQTRPGYNNAPIRVALLNEQQSTLVLTMMRNTEKVVGFKIALVRAFFEMARQVVAPVPTGPELMALALQEASRTLEAKDATIQALTPKASAWDTMAGAHGDYAVDEAAKILSRDPNITVGRSRLFTHMAERGWIYRHGARNRWHAYQSQVDNGRLVQRMSAAFLNHRTGELEVPDPTIRITVKGLEALRASLTPALELSA